jgi:hypothetical protein
MKYLIAAFKAADPDYIPPKGKKAIDSPWARWINGMSEATFKAYMKEEIEFSERMAIRRAVQRRLFYRDLGKTKSVDLNTGICKVVPE